jgi:hypothetical protein
MVIAISFSMVAFLFYIWSGGMDIAWLEYISYAAYVVCLIVAKIKESTMLDRISALEKQLTKKGGE